MSRMEKKKTIKSMIQLIILVFLGFILIRSIFFTTSFENRDTAADTNTEGFIALSYLGVDRSGNSKYISSKTLENQLKLLKDYGFETISQDDIIAFYMNNAPLPKRALFLSFEDGRNDSSIFSQPILEELNYQATMFTYADKMTSKDTKFLKPNDLNSMVRSGYWEIGSNGYQLTYINAFNAEGEYYGIIPENDMPDKTSIEYYNHYLMDYLRDPFMIPSETRNEMTERIEKDYNNMESIYKESLDEPVKAYAIMHANTLYNTMNEDVEAANDYYIREIFDLHFNRDTTSYNSNTDDLYNLSRLQVAPFWSTNHLLMRLNSESNIDIPYEIGNENQAEQWEIQDGVGNFNDNVITLTSLPNEEVLTTYQEPLHLPFVFEADMNGFVMGEQSIYLTGTTSDKQYQITLSMNQLSVTEHDLVMETENILINQTLNDIQWDGEDYRFKKATVYDYADTQRGSRIDSSLYPNTLKNDRHLSVSILDNSLVIQVDDQDFFQHEITSEAYTLRLAGQSIQEEVAYEQYSDNIYDAVFNNLSITVGETNQEIYRTESTQVDRLLDKIRDSWDRTIDFFIDTF